MISSLGALSSYLKSDYHLSKSGPNGREGTPGKVTSAKGEAALHQRDCRLPRQNHPEPRRTC